MQKGNLTREQAVAMVGEAAVCAAEEQGCEPTNRVGYNGSCQDDELCEWSACVSATDTDGYECAVIVYYYTDNQDDETMANNDGDGASIDWVIAGYEVV